jgi:hypothetical protein
MVSPRRRLLGRIVLGFVLVPVALVALSVVWDFAGPRPDSGIVQPVPSVLWLASLLEWPFRHLEPYSEVVLRPGMAVTIRSPLGPVTVAAGAGTDRTCSSPGWSEGLRLRARTDRWCGSLGLSNVDGVHGSFLLDEGQIHVRTRSDALRWLTHQAESYGARWTRDGLVCAIAGDGLAQPRPQRVELWQLYVNGRRPHDLPLSDDGAFTVTGGVVADKALMHERPVVAPLQMSGPLAAARHFGNPSLSPAPQRPR